MERTASRQGLRKSLLDGFEQGSLEVGVDEDGSEFWEEMGKAVEDFLVQAVGFACHQNVEERQHHPFVGNENVEDLRKGTWCCFECSICEHVRAVVIQDRQQNGTGENQSHVADTLMYTLNISSVMLFCGSCSFIMSFESV